MKRSLKSYYKLELKIMIYLLGNAIRPHTSMRLAVFLLKLFLSPVVLGDFLLKLFGVEPKYLWTPS